MEEIMVLNTSPEAATFRENLRGWVSRNGHFFSADFKDSEYLARYDGCTHRSCESCGEPAPRMYLLCDACRAKKRDEVWEKMEKKPWDGKTMICDFDGDNFYNDPDEAIEQILDEGGDAKNIRLLICEPVWLETIEANEHCVDDLPEDMTLEDTVGMEAVVDAFEKLNKAIMDTHGVSPICFRPGKVALDVSLYLPKD